MIHSRPSAKALKIFGAERSPNGSMGSTYRFPSHSTSCSGRSVGWTGTKRYADSTSILARRAPVGGYIGSLLGSSALDRCHHSHSASADARGQLLGVTSRCYGFGDDTKSIDMQHWQGAPIVQRKRAEHAACRPFLVQVGLYHLRVLTSQEHIPGS